MPRPKPWILAIDPYVPGRAVAADGRKLVKLSANENPLGTSMAAQLALRAERDPSRYPDPDARALREALGRLHALSAERIVCGTGSDELLNLAAQAFAGPGDEILFPRYSFAVYPIAARRCGATPIEAQDRDFGADVDSLIARISTRTRVVFLANPNNPTGSFLHRDELSRLHRALPDDVLLVVDQAYAEYLLPEEDDGAIELSRKSRNVLVTRTFSKIYGLASERVGWATGDPALLSALHRIRGPFNVTASGQAAALAALGDQDFVEASRAHNLAERERLAQRIASWSNRGVRALPSKANFLLLLFDGEDRACGALDALARADYAVRHLPGQGLAQALRITIGKSEDMEAVASCLAEFLGEKPKGNRP